MAKSRIKDQSLTVATVAGDDYIVVDGATNGTGKKLASSLVTLTDTQTLTNKTLTTPTIIGAIAFPDDTRQTFNPGANAAGLNVGTHSGDPATPANGDLWYNISSNALKARINGSTVSLGAGGGTGTVTGPVSSTDNAIVRWDGTGGATLQDSSVTVDDSGNVSVPGGVTAAGGLEVVGGLNDSNNNELFKFTATSSAVNELTVANAATGSAPTITASGGDTDVSINLVPKGAGTLQYGGVEVGYKILPQGSHSADYTGVLGDSGKHLLHPTADDNARTFTIPANGSVAYPTGTMITFVNQKNTLSIAITTDTMTLFAGSGTGTTGTRTLAAGGVATALKVASTSWIIWGVGLT